MPVSIGSTRCTGAGPAPFFACVRCALAVLFVIGGSLAPVVGTVCLGRRDSHADQGAVATQFSSSTGAGTSPKHRALALDLLAKATNSNVRHRLAIHIMQTTPRSIDEMRTLISERRRCDLLQTR